MSSWKMVPLGDAATFVNGFAFKPEDWGDVGIPIIRIQNLTGSSNIINYYNKPYNSKYEVLDGDILISWSASLGVYEWTQGKALLNQHIFKVVFDKLQYNKRFFMYIISRKLDEMSSATHGSTMKHITKKSFDAIKIPYPPLSVQQQIADALDCANHLIQKNRSQIEKLELLIKSRFIEMFGDPVTNPMRWELKKLSSMGELNRGVSKHRPRNDPELLGGIYPLIQTGDVANSGLYIETYSNTYSEVGLKQSKLWKKGTLCITIAANIAKTGILAFDACFPDSVVGFSPNSRSDTIFINYLFGFFQKILEEQAPESAQKNINLKILYELDVIAPPIALQTQFSDFVQQVDKLKFEMRGRLEKLEILYKSLMQQYFS